MGRSQRMELIKRLNIAHSVTKIKLEILNAYQRYILIEEKNCPVAFASYSLNGHHPPDFRIHKIYNLPGSEGKGYNKILISHIEALAMERGSAKLSVLVRQREKKEYFESLGFSASLCQDTGVNAELEFTMVKQLR